MIFFKRFFNRRFNIVHNFAAIAPGFVASVIPWANGRQHKETMTKVPYMSTFIWFLRDRGTGQVVIDGNGQSVPTYELSDPIDQKNFRHATVEAIRIHEAAGANEILFTLAHGLIAWKRGQNLEKFIENISGQALLAGAQPIISAHQMCTCRMGKDRSISVADVNGELYDTKGVWIGDGSACPTSLGANPMITIMALAARTADRIATRMKSASCGATGMGAMPDLGAMNKMAANVVSGMVGMMTKPEVMMREMAGMMVNPMNMFTLAGSVLAGKSPFQAPVPKPVAGDGQAAGPNAAGANFSHVIELHAKPGQAQVLITAIRDQAIPQVIATYEGFIEEIVLLSETDPNRVSAISFWRSKKDAENFTATGFAKVSAFLAGYLASPPVRGEYVVAAEINKPLAKK